MWTTTRAGAAGRWFAVGLVALSVGACGAEAPPFDELPLRDALSADPEVIAALPAEARRELAERLEEARLGASEGEEVRPEERATPAAKVRDADLAREARGEDALTLEVIEPRAGAFAVRALRLDKTQPCRELPPLGGPPPAPKTAEAEAKALEGRAGPILAELVERSRARQVVRVVGWPVGAAAVGDRVYVNPSWLVALAALEDPRAGKPCGAARAVASAPRMKPLSLKGNPYVSYPSLEACSSDIASRCDECLTSGNCEDRPALADFKDAREECAFLAEEPDRPTLLCALALLSVSLVADCVRREDPACSIPTGAKAASVDSARTFLSSQACVRALDVCLGAEPASSPSTSSPPNLKVSSCQDPFSACTSSCKGLSDSCKADSCSGTSSGSSCSSCNNSSGSSCGSCGSSSSSCGNSGSGCKCETASPPVFPLGPAAWLLAPLAYVFLRPRRWS